MDLLEDLLSGNQRYRESIFTNALAERDAPPRRKVAVVACMDARYVPENVLGLEPGDAHVIRSAGAIVDEGVLRSLVASVHLLGVRTVVHLPHTACGLMGLREKGDEVAQRLEQSLGKQFDGEQLASTLNWLQSFRDPRQHVEDSVARIRTHALIPDDLTVYGLIYDNQTGIIEHIS